MTYIIKLFIFILFFNFSHVYSQSLEDQYKDKSNPSEIFNKALSKMKNNLSGFDFYKCSESGFMSELSTALLAIKNKTIAIQDLNALIPSENFELFQNVRSDINGYQFSNCDILSCNKYQFKLTNDSKTGILYYQLIAGDSKLPTSKKTCILLTKNNNGNSGIDIDNKQLFEQQLKLSFEKECDKNDIKSCTVLGSLYSGFLPNDNKIPIILPTDYKKSIYYLSKACNIDSLNENVGCKLLLALSLKLHKENKFNIDDKFFIPASINICSFDVNLCMLSAFKFSELKDYKHMEKMFENACKFNKIEYCLIVGSIYAGVKSISLEDFTFSISSDFKKSIKYYRKVCDFDYKYCLVAAMKFLEVNKVAEAQDILNYACNFGIKEDDKSLMCYMQGILYSGFQDVSGVKDTLTKDLQLSLPVDSEKSIRYFLKSCELSAIYCYPAALNLSENKQIIPVQKVLINGCNSDDFRSCLYLGFLYSNGKNNKNTITFSIDYEKSFNYFSKACNLNASQACRLLILNFLKLREENKFDIDDKLLMPIILRSCSIDGNQFYCNKS